VTLALNDFLRSTMRKESRSLLQYVSESFPWTTRKQEGHAAAIGRMAKTEFDALGRLGRVLLKSRAGVPMPGSYPQSFTTINFMALDFLLPLLIVDQKERIAELEEGLAWLVPGEAKDAVADLVDLKKRHLAEMESLAKG
jgi:hypothetical protein